MTNLRLLREFIRNTLTKEAVGGTSSKGKTSYEMTAAGGRRSASSRSSSTGAVVGASGIALASSSNVRIQWEISEAHHQGLAAYMRDNNASFNRSRGETSLRVDIDPSINSEAGRSFGRGVRQLEIVANKDVTSETVNLSGARFYVIISLGNITTTGFETEEVEGKSVHNLSREEWNRESDELLTQIGRSIRIDIEKTGSARISISR